MLLEKNDSIYQNFAKEHSPFFYQISLLLEDNQCRVAWRLFAIFYELNPLFFWKIKDGLPEFIKIWKNRIFSGLAETKFFKQNELNLANFGTIKSIKSTGNFPESFLSDSSGEEELSYPRNQVEESAKAWQEIKVYLDTCSKDYLLNLLNSLSYSLYSLRFFYFSDLRRFLEISGGSIALFAFRILFRKELLREQEVSETNSISLLGSLVLWWYLLRKIPFLVKKNKLLVSLDHLGSFRSTERDFIAQIKTKDLKNLTEFQLQQIISDLRKVYQRSQSEHPKKIKELISFIVKVLSEEISSTLESDWQLSSVSGASSTFIEGKRKSPWLIRNFSKFKKKSPIIFPELNHSVNLF